MANKGKAKKATVQADFYVGFNGANPQTNVEEPKLGEQVEYTILGQVRKVAESIRDDNETRLNIGIEVLSAWPKGSKRPDNANQALMFDHDGKTTAEAEGRTDAEVKASADEGDELAALRRERTEISEAAGVAEGIDPETGEAWEYPAGEPARDKDGN